jgi:hypothetical protein
MSEEEGSGAKTRDGWIDLAGKKRSGMLGEAGFVRVEGDRYWTEP